jgi:hypothetical protein
MAELTTVIESDACAVSPSRSSGNAYFCGQFRLCNRISFMDWKLGLYFSIAPKTGHEVLILYARGICRVGERSLISTSILQPHIQPGDRCKRNEDRKEPGELSANFLKNFLAHWNIPHNKAQTGMVSRTLGS